MLRERQKDFAAVALRNEKGALVDHVQAPRGTRKRRLGVYRTNTVNSLTDVLMAAFPVILRIVGKRFFRAMAQSFIETHPPTQPTLYRYGEKLSGFLSTFAPASEMPYLPDVARLEWARIEAYFAVDHAPMDPTALSAIAPDRLGDVVFSAHPSLSLVHSPFPVFEIWAVNQTNNTSIPEIDFDRSEHGLILRRDHIVTQRLLDEDQFHWLEQLFAQNSLGQSTETTTASFPTFDLQNTLRLLLAEGVFVDADVAED